MTAIRKACLMLVAFALEGLVLIGLVLLMRWNRTFGIVMMALWVFAGFGTITLTFSELAEEPKEVKPKQRPEPDAILPVAGSIGKAVSALNPAGTVEFDGKRFDAKSVLSLIRAGSFVRVVESHDRTLVVEERKDT